MAGGGSDKSGGTALIVISCIAACILAAALRKVFMQRRRRKRFAQPDTNAAVIYAWRYISRLNRHAPPPEELEELALKARFSQHRLSEDERAMMIDGALKYVVKTSRWSGVFRRIWIKYIY